MQTINYEGMGVYYNKSPRALRRWEKDKPQKFELMLNEYNMQKEIEFDETNKIVVVLSQKGGVGKTTIADALGYYLGDSVILNVDLSQNTKDINSCETVDYIDVMHKHKIKEIVKQLSKHYRHIIIDTPGDLTDEVKEALNLSNKIIIPMTIGKKTRVKTESTLETFFGEGSEFSGVYNIFFFFNAYVNKKKRDIATNKFLEMFKSMKFASNIEIKPKLSSLDYSDAIFTAEEEGKSIFALADKNKVAYKSILIKINKLCSSIENHLEL